MSVYGPSGAIAEAIKYNWKIARDGWRNKLIQARTQLERDRIALVRDLERAKRGRFVITKLLPAKSKAMFKQALYTAEGRITKKAGEQVPSNLVDKVDETAYAIANAIALMEFATRATFDRRAMKKAIEDQEFAELTQDLLDTLLITINMQGSTRDNPIVNIALEMVDALKTMQFEAKVASTAMQTMANKLDQEQQVREQLTEAELETVKTQKQQLQTALDESRDNYQVLLTELQKMTRIKKLKTLSAAMSQLKVKMPPFPPRRVGMNEYPHCNHHNPPQAVTCRVCNLSLPRDNAPSIMHSTTRSKLAVFDLDTYFSTFHAESEQPVVRTQRRKYQVV